MQAVVFCFFLERVTRKGDICPKLWVKKRYPSSHEHSTCERVAGRSFSSSRDPLSGAMLVGGRVSKMGKCKRGARTSVFRGGPGGW